jgi:hypothetical protein
MSQGRQERFGVRTRRPLAVVVAGWLAAAAVFSLLPAQARRATAVLAAAMSADSATEQPSADCSPHGVLRFICGLPAPEDLVAVPRSPWVVASGYSRGGVHLIDSRTFTPTQVFPAAAPRERHDTRRYGACPGPLAMPRKDQFSAHGLALRAGARTVHTVYLVHHGERESIEVFEVDTAPRRPTFTWIGCIVAPDSAVFNSVAPLPGDGLVATNPRRRSVPPGTHGVATGEVWEWHPSAGWAIVPGSESEGPNGIETSSDGSTLYVDLWPARKLMRLSRGARAPTPQVVDVPFHPDNIRWQQDGSLFVAGHGGRDLLRVAQCVFTVCDDATSNVARVDPNTLAIHSLITLPAHESFFSSTVALQVGREIWIGAVAGNRIARHPLP